MLERFRQLGNGPILFCLIVAFGCVVGSLWLTSNTQTRLSRKVGEQAQELRTFHAMAEQSLKDHEVIKRQQTIIIRQMAQILKREGR